MKLNGTFIPGEDYYLIEPLKEIKLSKKVTVRDDSVEPDKDGVHQVKQVRKTVPANYQLAKVLAKPTNERAKFNVDDTVVYRNIAAAAVDFDLIKGAKLIRFYDVIGLWQS